MSQLGALLQALRVLRAARAADAPAELCESLVELLLADLTWLDDGTRPSVARLAKEFMAVGTAAVEDEGWELVGGEEEATQADSWLETLLRLVRAYSVGSAFGEAHVLVLEMLLETPDRPFCKSEPPWPALSLASDELETCEALYGEALSRYDDRIEVTVEDRLGVVYRVSSQELARVEARGVQSGATTGDERLANAAYAVLQRFRGGQLTLTEALRLAQSVAGRWMAPVSASFVPRLFLAASPGSWLGLRQETASLVLDFFSPQQAAKEAIKVMQKYLERHEQFQPAGPAEVVVNDRLGARFERKLAQLRTHVTPSLVTPSLVFHGAPSQEVLRSICQRGFLLPGDWIEGTPDFLELAHGNVKGVGVYTSPCLDTAARYSGVLDSEEVGLVLVALAAPGHCWHEKSREQTQEMIASWFFPPEPKVGDKHEGWVWLGDGWHPCGMESSTRRSEARSSNLASLAFAPDTDALYDGRFHSRRFGAGTKVSEELVLGSTDQLLPLLLLLPFARRQQNSTSRTPLPPLPGLGPRGKRLRVLCGSNVHVYPSDPLPEKQLLCSKVLADEQMDLWAVHVPTSIGSKKGAKSLNSIFLVDEALSTEFQSEVSSLISCLSGQLQGQACGASFNCGGINPTTCVPFLPCETFRASFLPRWASAASAASAAPGGSLGDLAGAVEYAVEVAIGKLVKDTERILQQNASCWALLREGLHLESKEGPSCLIREVTFDRQQPISLEVEWKPHGKRQSSTKLRTVTDANEAYLQADMDGTTYHFLPPQKLKPPTPADVAAQSHFVVVLLSSFSSKEKAGSALLSRLESVLHNCGTQFRCSGCSNSTIPLILGPGASPARLAAFVQEGLSTTAPWWMPFYQAEVRADVPRLMEQLTEDVGTWQKSWDDSEGLHLAVGAREAQLGSGFLVTPEAPTWQVTLRPDEVLEDRGQSGQCILFKGQLPRRDVWVDGEEYALQILEPPAVSLTDARLEHDWHWRRAVEIALALERLSQQLRAAALARGAGSAAGWVERVKAMAAALAAPRLDKEKLQTWTRLPPLERAALATRLRALSSGLQRTANAIHEVVELERAAEQEPSSAAWLKRASQMKYGVKVLQRAKKSGVAEDQDLWLKQLDALLALELPEQQNDGVAVRSMVTGAAALEQFQEMKQMAPQLRSLRPSAALYSCGAVGVALRLRRSDATEVEPWLLLVEHVSTSYVDTASAALYLDANQILHDDAGEVAPDVAVLAMEPADFYKWFRTSEMYKSYLAMVFTRNPLGQVPGQAYALPVILWVKTAELLISRAPKSSSQRDPSDAIPSEEAQWFRAMLRIHLTAAETVRQMTQSRGATSELAEALAGPDPSAALTEAEGGPQSVCLALAACCFAPSALRNFWGQRGLELARSRSLQRAHSKTLQRGEEDDRAGWPKRLRRLALAMMAEAVSRACRRLVRSVCLSSNEAEGEVLKKLLWNALGLDQSSVAPVSALGEPDDPKLAKPEGHSDECDVVIAQRKSALLFAPQGKYFQVALTNCTPQGVVGTLMLHMAMLQGTLDPSSDQAVELLMKQLWTREISMKAFVEAVLPGEVSPGSVQAALYVQGLRYHSAKQRRGGLAPLSAPEQILHTLAREQRHLAYLEQLRAKLASQSSGARKAARSAKRQVELSTFAPAHAGLPRRFTPKEISDLNVCREASDQLELLPNGLLCHHCCFPSCPRYLCDLRTEKDKLAQASEAVGRNAVLASRRNGLFRHLAPMMYPEAQGEDVYIPQLHAGIQYALQRGGGKEGFKKNLRDLLKKRLRPPATEVLHSQWLEEALDRCFDEAPR